ncbi:hypothetical protein [uncultured Massilia sp.]|uniref:hypothetical protein n=1 Tax=uncultured Massilia sp. TaxID=169973 RepID=UPI0025F0CCD0|nr:hypothetical protein [uncultured Massilia sp.]
MKHAQREALRRLLAAALAASVCAQAGAGDWVAPLAPAGQPQPPQSPQQQEQEQEQQRQDRTSARPGADAIRAAVRATLAEQPGNPRLHEADTLRANRYDAFARQVEDATVPDCLHADGLKRQPTFFLSGVLALSFIPIAWLRGKCQ